MDYVEELKRVMAEEKFSVPGSDINDPRVAKSIYETHIWLKDPALSEVISS